MSADSPSIVVHEAAAEIERRHVVRRRHFLRTVGLGAMSALGAGSLPWRHALAAKAPAVKKRGLACIVLWMQGGPSQMETFDPKPGHENGGELKAIATDVPGIQISESLPQTAQVMKHVCLVRSMNSKEGSHPRATFLTHTGYLPTSTVKYPSLGSLVTHQIGDLSFELPTFVRLNGGRFKNDCGFLGVDYDSFSVDNPRELPRNMAAQTAENRFKRRLNLLGKLEGDYAANGGKQEVEDHQKLYGKASRLVLSPKNEVFDLSKEPEKARAAYGDTNFAAGCLLARRLVEAGVTFIEVNLGNWDTHFDNFSRTKELTQELDQPYAQLLRDLADRGLLDTTLVVWMGEFGRTPKINARVGRDHFPKAYCAALAGGGVKGGQVIGKTDAGGVTIEDRPVGIPDLLRTVCHTLKVDADKENMSGIGRPIKVVDGGEVIKEAFGA